MIKFKEILTGRDFKNAVKELKLTAKETYKESETSDRYREPYSVWELSDESFDIISAVEEDEWKDEWGWWRYADGTNIEESPKLDTNINNKKITVWISQARLADEIDDELEDMEDDGEDYISYNEIGANILSKKRYESLTEYCLQEWGAGLERNVCAITVGLAKLNDMSLSELWRNYQG